MRDILLTYKFLTAFLYMPECSFLKREGNLVTLKTYHFSLYMKKDSTIVRNYVNILADRGYIEDLEVSQGTLRFRLIPPRGASYDQEEASRG